VFGKLLDTVSSGKADGIIAWHPDRLARLCTF
jgi:DNA invertase Pin-like site-specific DNA recombinase